MEIEIHEFCRLVVHGTPLKFLRPRFGKFSPSRCSWNKPRARSKAINFQCQVQVHCRSLKLLMSPHLEWQKDKLHTSNRRRNYLNCSRSRKYLNKRKNSKDSSPILIAVSTRRSPASAWTKSTSRRALNSKAKIIQKLNRSSKYLKGCHCLRIATHLITSRPSKMSWRISTWCRLWIRRCWGTKLRSKGRRRSTLAPCCRHTTTRIAVAGWVLRTTSARTSRRSKQHRAR